MPSTPQPLAKPAWPRLPPRRRCGPGQLVDVSGRNTLHFYKDLPVSTLDLGTIFSTTPAVQPLAVTAT